MEEGFQELRSVINGREYYLFVHTVGLDQRRGNTIRAFGISGVPRGKPILSSLT